jgi:hypothetical protein
MKAEIGAIGDYWIGGDPDLVKSNGGDFNEGRKK